MQPAMASLQTERDLSPRSPKTPHRIQDDILGSSTVALGIQILVFNFKRTTCDPENLLQEFPAKPRARNSCGNVDEWSEYVLCP